MTSTGLSPSRALLQSLLKSNARDGLIQYKIDLSEDNLFVFEEVMGVLQERHMQLSMGVLEDTNHFDVGRFSAFPDWHQDNVIISIDIRVERENIGKYPMIFFIQTDAFKISGLLEGRVEFVHPFNIEDVDLEWIKIGSEEEEIFGPAIDIAIS